MNIFHDSWVAALLGEIEGGFAVICLRLEIAAVLHEGLENFEMTVSRSGDRRRVTCAIAIISVRAMRQQPRHDFSVPAGHGSGERVVPGAVDGRGVYVGAIFEQKVDDL